MRWDNRTGDGAHRAAWTGARCARGARGSVLLVTVVMGGFIGFTLMAYLSLVYQQNRSIQRSQAWNYSIVVAETGIEEGLTHLQYSYNNLTENGWVLSSNAYVKRRVLGEGYYEVAISNVTPPVLYSQGYVRIPGTTNYIPSRTVRLDLARNSLFRRGLVAKGNIDMSGNNLKTDSYDSTNPAMSTNGRYDPAKARDNGDVATNSGLVNSFKLGNANIYGHAATGPGGQVSYGPNGAVGSAAWQAAGNKGIQPGWFSDDMNVNFPDVNEPYTTGTTPSSGSVGGTNYAYVLGNGQYKLTSLSLSGQNKVAVTGAATLYVTGAISLGGQSFIYIATNASLNLYAGNSVTLSGKGAVNANASATNFFLWGLPGCTDLKLSGNAAFVGVIYAPEASFTMGGGGSDTMDFCGASVTGAVSLNGHYNFHYDERLSRDGPSMGFVISSWNEL